jgi:LuxR family transcriptional regulator, positive regulator of biofilm formation
MMDILVNLGNHLISLGLQDLLVRHGYDAVVIRENDMPEGFVPQVVLADTTTIDRRLCERFPNAKILMIDTGLEKEKIVGTLLTYKIHGVLSTCTGVHLLKRALKVVQQGRLWIDHDTVKALLNQGRETSRVATAEGIGEKEQMVIDLVNKGCTNREIASGLFVSVSTVKAHLSRIFRKLNVTRRAGLRGTAGGSQISADGSSSKLLMHKMQTLASIAGNRYGTRSFPKNQEPHLPESSPRCLPQAEKRAEFWARAFMGPRRGCHALVVDDQEDMISLTTSMLERLGHSTQVETQSLKALKTFSERPDRFDFAILEHLMPELTGLELAERFRRIRRGFPVLLYTGYPDRLSTKTIEAAGIGRVLVKPLTMEELGGALREAVHR